MPPTRVHHRAAPPFWLPLAAGLPIVLSLAVMALPDIAHDRPLRFRALYLALFVLWTVPLTWMQRWLWQRRVGWWALGAIVLATTYLMAVANNGLGVVLRRMTGSTAPVDWTNLFQGLDACWLSLMTFAAVHAVVTHGFELSAERERVARAVAAQRDAELRALRLQLQPHFLFNTLNAVSSLVATARNAEAQGMIARLADFLRATLDGDAKHETALAEELAMAEGYLDIERARLGARLRVQWQIGPDVLNAQVPSLLLQPLIENAIRHGIARRTAPGLVRIEVAREADRLGLRIVNDLADTPDAGAGGDRDGDRIGLRNLAERLSVLYGDAHALTAQRQDGVFCVAIRLPFRSAGMAAPARSNGP